MENVGQECIGSRWVVTRKEEHDSQKMQIKARLVLRGFQEVVKPQSDSPTVAKESLKVLIVLASNNDLRWCQWILEWHSCKQKFWIEKCLCSRQRIRELMVMCGS